MNINEKIAQIREKICGGDNKLFAQKLGVSEQYASNICKIGKKVGEKQRDHILEVFPEINRAWFLADTGEMLKKTPPQPQLAEEKEFGSSGYMHVVPLLPISAQGGTFNDFVTSIKDNECEKVVSPVKGIDMAVTVSGDSMAPEYPNGCQVLIKRINEEAFIEWGKVYVLDTCNGTVIKEVRRGKSEDEVECYSINPDPKFQPFSVKFDDIYGMYRVIMCMSLK